MTMTIGPCFAERRKQPRFQIGPGAWVVKNARPGLISDLSLEGLSWRYIDRKSWPAPPSPTLDILIEGRDLSLTGLPCRLIADGEAEHDGPDPALAVRRRSVQFDKLTADQRARLEKLIRQHAAAPLQPVVIPN
jgi:hypothetical protein